MKYLLTIVLLFSFNQVMATGFFVTGNDLLEWCETYLNDAGSVAEANICSSYIVGIVDVQSTFVDWKHMESRWCLPANAKGVQLVRVVTKYLQENPQALHKGAGSMVANALGLAFPCDNPVDTAIYPRINGRGITALFTH